MVCKIHTMRYNTIHTGLVYTIQVCTVHTIQYKTHWPRPKFVQYIQYKTLASTQVCIISTIQYKTHSGLHAGLFDISLFDDYV